MAEDAGPGRDDGSAARVDAARRRLYRGAATEADLDAYLALRDDLRHRRAASSPAVEETSRVRGLVDHGPRTGPLLRAPTRPWVVAVRIAVAVALFGTGVTAGIVARPVPVPEPTATGTPAEPLVATLTRLGAGSASPTRGTRVVAASDVLDGGTPIQALGLPAAARVELVVRCPARDRSFRASITPVGRLSITTTLAGPCGGIGYYELPSRDGTQVQVLITTEGSARCSAVLLLR